MSLWCGVVSIASYSVVMVMSRPVLLLCQLLWGCVVASWSFMVGRCGYRDPGQA